LPHTTCHRGEEVDIREADREEKRKKGKERKKEKKGERGEIRNLPFTEAIDEKERGGRKKGRGKELKGKE